ncbi:MAG: STAS/SEC14 domain-containing protein [Chloroflexota bacterium]
MADEYGDVCLLLDLEEFAGKEARTWLPGLKFGHRFHDNIVKMASGGDKRWHKWLAALAERFNAEDPEFFRLEEKDRV